MGRISPAQRMVLSTNAAPEGIRAANTVQPFKAVGLQA